MAATPYQFTWFETAAAVAVFFAILTFTGCLLKHVVKNFHHFKKNPSMPATPAGITMTMVTSSTTAEPQSAV